MNIKKYKNYLFLLPFIFLFLILLNWHHSIGLSVDDLFFYTIPQETNIMSFVIERYDIWSSRILIEYILCHILQSPLILWWYLDSLIFTFIAILTYKLINGKNKLFYSIFLIIDIELHHMIPHIFPLFLLHTSFLLFQQASLILQPNILLAIQDHNM